MNYRHPFVVTSLILLSTFSSAAANAGDYAATLEVMPGLDLKLKQSGFFSSPTVSVQGGPVTVTTENQGSIFDSTFVISTPDRKSFKIKVPKGAYTAGANLSVNVPAGNTGQSIGFRGEARSRDLNSWKEMGTQNCSVRAFGYSCGLHTPMGEMMPEMGCGLGYYDEYHQQDVVLTKKKVQEAFAGSIVDAKGNVVARIHPVLQEREEEINRKVASPCGQSAPAELGEAIRKSQQQVEGERDPNDSLFPEDANKNANSAL